MGKWENRTWENGRIVDSLRFFFNIGKKWKMLNNILQFDNFFKYWGWGEAKHIK